MVAMAHGEGLAGLGEHGIVCGPIELVAALQRTVEATRSRASVSNHAAQHGDSWTVRGSHTGVRVQEPWSRSTSGRRSSCAVHDATQYVQRRAKPADMTSEALEFLQSESAELVSHDLTFDYNYWSSGAYFRRLVGFHGKTLNVRC